MSRKFKTTIVIDERTYQRLSLLRITKKMKNKEEGKGKRASFDGVIVDLLDFYEMNKKDDGDK